MIAYHAVTGHIEQHPLMHEHAAAGRFSHRGSAPIVWRFATRLKTTGCKNRQACSQSSLYAMQTLPRLLICAPVQPAPRRRPRRQPLRAEAAALAVTVGAVPPQAPRHEDLLHAGADQDPAAC